MPIHSDWGNWLPKAIDSASPSGLAIWYLGCNGFVVKASDGTTLFIDPYLGLGDPPRTTRMISVPFAPTDITAADALLITHEHSDHVHGPTQGPILEKTDATYYAPDDSIAITREEDWQDSWQFKNDQLVQVTEGETVEIGGCTIRVEPAYDPDALHPVSYIIEHAGHTFFHGGDTKPADSLRDIGAKYEIGLGVLAFGSVGMLPDKQTREPARTRWYCDENQIIEAANALNLDRLLPSHWDMWRGLTADPTVLHHHAQSFEYPHDLEIVEIGDRIDLA